MWVREVRESCVTGAKTSCRHSVHVTAVGLRSRCPFIKAHKLPCWGQHRPLKTGAESIQGLPFTMSEPSLASFILSLSYRVHLPWLAFLNSPERHFRRE